MPPITWRAPRPCSEPTSSNAASATCTRSRSRSRRATPITRMSARRSSPPTPARRQAATEGREPVILRANYPVVKHFLGPSENPHLAELRFPHVQTSIDRGPPDPGHFADRRGGLWNPRDLFDRSTALADAARARPAAQAAI